MSPVEATDMDLPTTMDRPVPTRTTPDDDTDVPTHGPSFEPPLLTTHTHTHSSDSDDDEHAPTHWAFTKSIPDFCGNTSGHRTGDAWLSKFERQANTHSLADDQRLSLALSKMSDAALRWTDANEGIMPTWADFKRLFRKRFGEPREITLQRYNTEAQSPTEDVATYADRLAELRD